ncbi:hypothetical protein, partial [Campylobacter coli]
RIIGSFCFVFERTNSPNKKNSLIRLAVKARGSEVQKTMAKYTKRRDKRGLNGIKNFFMTKDFYLLFGILCLFVWAVFYFL